MGLRMDNGHKDYYKEYKKINIGKDMYKKILSSVGITILFIGIAIQPGISSNTIQEEKTGADVKDFLFQTIIDIDVKNWNKQNINRINVTYESGNYTLYAEIYYPKDMSKLYPAVIFCEGNGGYISAYSWIPMALASEDYVAMIFDFPGQGQSEGLNPIRGISFPALNIYLRFGHFLSVRIHYKSGDFYKATIDSLDYLLEKSPVNQIINKTKLGLIGHSMGGVIVTEVAAKDKRVDAVIALSHGESSIIANITIPIQFQLGSFDMTSSIPIILSCYKKANPPKELISISGGTHVGFTTVFSSFCPCPPWQKFVCLTYAIGWFDYFLKNKSGSYETITTGMNHLSKIIPSYYNFGDGDHRLKYGQ